MTTTHKHSFLHLLPALAAAALLLPLLGACNTSGCTDNHSALPLMAFYNCNNGERIMLDSIDLGGVGAPADSLLVISGQRCDRVYLPFRQDAAVTRFFIHYDYKEQGLDDPAFNDTLTFTYTAEPYFASSECGAMYQYRIVSASTTHNLIESIAITDSLITNVERERIQIFFRVATPDEETPGEGNGQ